MRNSAQSCSERGISDDRVGRGRELRRGLNSAVAVAGSFRICAEAIAGFDRGHHRAGRFMHVFAILETAGRGETIHLGKSQSLCVELFDGGREIAHAGRVDE